MNAIADDTPESDSFSSCDGIYQKEWFYQPPGNGKNNRIKVTAAYKLLKEMCAEHLIKSVGKGRLTKYVMD